MHSLEEGAGAQRPRLEQSCDARAGTRFLWSSGSLWRSTWGRPGAGCPEASASACRWARAWEEALLSVAGTMGGIGPGEEEVLGLGTTHLLPLGRKGASYEACWGLAGKIGNRVGPLEGFYFPGDPELRKWGA